MAKKTNSVRQKASGAMLPTWDLTAIYAEETQWESDFGRLPELAERFSGYAGRLGESAETLREALEAGEAFERLADRLQSYASLKSDEDTRVSENRERVGRLGACLARLAPSFAWFEPELLSLDEGKVASFLAEPGLAFWRRHVEETLRSRAHTLSEPEERLLGQLSDVLNASSTTFEALNDSDLTFGRLRDGDGHLVTLTHGSYHCVMEDGSRAVREAAFRRLYRRYREFRTTFASTLDATMRLHATAARIRHFPSSLESALFGDRVPREVYERLIGTVHERLGHLHRYMELRRRALKLESLDMWDVYNPLLPDCRRTVAWSEAVEMVQTALQPLGEEYLGIVGQAFEQRWIDAAERPGKRSGGYSGGSYDTYPYILLNYQGTLDDVFTLIHELGHSVHSHYSRRTQAYTYANYRIFVAEVASTTNEILLAEHLLRTTRDRAMRLHLLEHLINEIRLTIYRQTMFAEFEMVLHERAERGEPLTADSLEQSYYELNERYHGFTADRLIGLEWARIPHFYYDFYVYQYATGMSAAIQLAKRLLTGGEQAREDYLGFLKAGCSRDVLDILRGAGVDLSTPEPVAAALDYFGSLVDQLEREMGL